MDTITLKHIAQYLPFALNRRFNITGIEFTVGKNIDAVNARVNKCIDNIVKELPEGTCVKVTNREEGCLVTIAGQEFKNDYQY